MNEEPTEPSGQRDPVPIIIWVFCAFAPSLIGIALLDIKNKGAWLGGSLLALNIVCSFLAAFGLLRGVIDMGSRVSLAFMLAFFLFLLNVVIVVFAGCSKMGPM
jgi:hypothetical protein